MHAGLHPFGTDFGNAHRDRQYFQIDDEREAYAAVKAASPARSMLEERYEAPLRAVIEWMEATLSAEHPGVLVPVPPREGDLQRRCEAVSAACQEDFVVIRRGPGPRDAAIAVDVRFPSSWRPERICGWSFREIHGPVPGFADSQTAARRMVRAMIERGPYVRFVWTVCADDALDHHPDRGGRVAWSPESAEGWLRVERQVTIPFARIGTALFLIRTYRYPFRSLSAVERSVLASALRAMPAPIAAYKGLAEHGVARAVALLNAARTLESLDSGSEANDRMPSPDPERDRV